MTRRLGLAAALAAAVLLQACLPGLPQLPQSPVLKILERRIGLIAYTGADGNVYTIDQTGGNQKSITEDASVQDAANGPALYYQYATWSPDGRSIAYVGVQRDGGNPSAFGVFVSKRDGGGPRNVFQSLTEVPRLLSWAPDGSRLAFLGADRTNSSEQFYLVGADGGPVKSLASGTAMAWRWQRSTGELVLHASDGVTIVDPSGTASQLSLALQPGDFEAPAWSIDGTGVIVALQQGGSSALYLADRLGEVGSPLAQLDGGVSFDVSPDGKSLAYTMDVGSGGDRGTRLSLLPLGAAPGKGKPRMMSGTDLVAAFFWSPDSRRVAYFALDVTPDSSNSPQILLTLKVLDVRSGGVRRIASFHPSPFFLDWMRDFGQYGESLRVWSPDSRYLLYCSLDDTGPAVMVAYADAPIKPRKVVDGLIASWSPK